MTFSYMVGSITESSQGVTKERSVVELISRYCELIFMSRRGLKAWRGGVLREFTGGRKPKHVIRI